MPITRTWSINGTTGRQEVVASGSHAPFEVMTQAAYDLITPDPDTLYVIVG